MEFDGNITKTNPTEGEQNTSRKWIAVITGRALCTYWTSVLESCDLRVSRPIPPTVHMLQYLLIKLLKT